MVNVSTDIANMALDLLSAGNVSNIEIPTTPTESLAARWYDHSRRNLLRSHPWNFATKTIVLAASSEQPPFGGKAFPLPTDFVRLLYISGINDTPIDTTRFRMGNVGGKRCIIMHNTEDASSVNLVYIYDIKDVSRFDDLFIELLIHDLALSMAYKTTESNGNVDRINSLKEVRRTLAQAIDGQESPPYIVQRSRSRAARRNLGTYRTDRINF
jgi:hypothetical protein